MHKVRGLNMAFSSNLKYLMDYFDVSNYKLAQYIKSSQTSVKNWVTGERLPHPKTQKLIAELFGVTVEELNADEFPHIKGEHKLPLQKKARPSPAPVRTRRGRYRFAPGEPAEVVMALYDLSDRLNWQQACEILGCSKTHLYRLVREGKVPIYGTGKRYRWFSRENLEHILAKGFSERITLTK